MNELPTGVPIDAITKGKAYGDVLQAYQRFFHGAYEIASRADMDEDDRIADAMAAAIYRIYILGVQDGMA